MKWIYILLVFSILILSACSKDISDTKNSGMKNNQSANQIANPASKFCVEQGYQNVIRTNPDGSQTGYCIFPVGNECEEWKYFRGECKNE